MANVLQNSVSPSQIALAEGEVFKSVGWKLPQLICPLEIIRSVCLLLKLNVKNSLTELLFFSENITNFVLWSKWGESSVYSISIATLIVFCEFNDYNNDIESILGFSAMLFETIGSDLRGEITATRKFIFVNLRHLSDDEDLINKAEVLIHVPL